MTAAVVVLIDDYREAFRAGVSVGWDQGTGKWSVFAEALTNALANHLSAPVTARLAGGVLDCHVVTLTVTGADPDDVDAAADLYLGSASIAYRTEAA